MTGFLLWSVQLIQFRNLFITYSVVSGVKLIQHPCLIFFHALSAKSWLSIRTLLYHNAAVELSLVSCVLRGGFSRVPPAPNAVDQSLLIFVCQFHLIDLCLVWHLLETMTPLAVTKSTQHMALLYPSLYFLVMRELFILCFFGMQWLGLIAN